MLQIKERDIVQTCSTNLLQRREKIELKQPQFLGNHFPHMHWYTSRLLTNPLVRKSFSFNASYFCMKEVDFSEKLELPYLSGKTSSGSKTEQRRTRNKRWFFASLKWFALSSNPELLLLLSGKQRTPKPWSGFVLHQESLQLLLPAGS